VVASLTLSGVTVVSSADSAEAAKRYRYRCEVSGGGDWDGRARTGMWKRKKSDALADATNRVLNRQGWIWAYNEVGTINVWHEETWEIRNVTVSCWIKR
jgi:hypothetical protein